MCYECGVEARNRNSSIMAQPLTVTGEGGGKKVTPGISRVLDGIETKFRRLYPPVRGQPFQWNH